MSKAPRACVIGWPVEHSRSPAIYGYWLRQYGIDGAYEKEAVRPEDLAAFLSDLPAYDYVGANVTLPHKEAALHAARRGRISRLGPWSRLSLHPAASEQLLRHCVPWQ